MLDPQESNTPTGGDYIDVRGVWPVYRRGLYKLELVGKDRDITLQVARKIVRELQA